MESILRKPYLALALALLLGTVFWLLPLPYFQLDYDGGIYSLLGRNWAEGKGYTLGGYPNTVYAPLYPAVFAAFSALSLDLETAGLVFSLLCWWAAIVFFYLLAKELWQESTAFWASLLLAGHGFVISSFTRFLADVLFIPLLLASLWLCLKIYRRGMACHAPTFVAWILVGIAMTLTKTEGAYFFLLQLLFLLVFWPQPLRKKFSIIMLTFALFLAGLFPYLHFMKEATGRYQLSRKLSINLAMTRRSSAEDWQIYDRVNFALNPDNKTVPLYNGPDKAPGPVIRENFPQLLRNYAANLKSAFKLLAGALQVTGFLLLVVFVYSLRRKVGAQSRRGGMPLLLLCLTLLLGASHLFFLYERRVLVQYFILIILLLGEGMGYVYHRLREKYPLKNIWIAGLAAILLLTWIGPSQWQALRRAGRTDPREDFQQQKATGLLLKKSIPTVNKEKIIALKPIASFYSGADFLHLPYIENADDLYQYMINNQAKLLVISAGEIAEKRPALAKLASENGDERWQLVSKVEGKKGKGVYVYQVNQR